MDPALVVEGRSLLPGGGWEELTTIALAGPGDVVFTLDGDTEATMAWIRDMRSGQVRAIRGDLDEPSVPPGHVVRWSRGIPDRAAWRLRIGWRGTRRQLHG